MSNARAHLRNLAFNWGGHVATLLVMFFLSPYVVGRLDAVSYGIWSLLNVLTGYMGVFDLGARASVGRHVALYMGKGDDEAVNETVRAGLGFFSVTAGFILLVGLILGWFFPQLFRSVPVEHHGTVRFLLPFMVINVWLSATAAIYSSVLAAHDRFDVARALDLGSLGVRTAGTVMSLHLGWGLWGLAGAVVLSNLVAVEANRHFAARQHKGLRSWPFLYSRKRVLELVNYGLLAFVGTVAFKMSGQTDLIIAGAALGVADVREYSVGATLVYYSGTFVSLIGRTFFPAIQRAVAGGKLAEARWLFGRQIRVALVFGICAYVGMAAFSRPFIRLWMGQATFGEDSVVAAAQVMSILAVGTLPLLYTNAARDLLAAMGHIQFTAVISLVEAVVNVGLSLVFVLCLGLGLSGIAAGTLVARLSIGAVAVPIVTCAKAGLQRRSVVLGVAFPVLVAGSCFAAICISVQRLVEPRTWSLFLLDVAVCTVLYCLLVAPFLLPQDYRARLMGCGRRLRGTSSMLAADEEGRS